MDIAELGLVVDSSGLKRGAVDLKQFAATGMQAQTAAKSVEVAAKQMGLGVSSSSQMAVNGMEKLAQSSTRTAASMNVASKSTNRLVAIMGGNTFRMMSIQLGQVAQQATAGGNALQALAIQAADIGMLFGTIGTLVGAAAGALVPLAIGFLGAGDEAKEADKVFKDMSTSLEAFLTLNDQAVMSLDDLTQRFGTNAAAARDNFKALSDLARLKAVEDLREAVNSVSGEVTGLVAQFARMQSLSGRNARYVTQQIAELEAKTGLTVEQANRVNAAFEAMGQARGLEDSQMAAQELADSLADAFGGADKIPPELQTAAQNALIAANAGYEIEAALNGSSNGAKALASALASAAGFSMDLERDVQMLDIQIEATRNKQNAANAVRIAGLKLEADAKRAAAIAGGEDLLTANARYALDLDAIKAMESKLATLEQLNTSTKASTATTSRAATAEANLLKQLQEQVKTLNEAADPLLAYNSGISELNMLLEHGLSSGAYDKAVQKLNDELADSIPMVSSVSDAFSDWLQRGLTDFNTFAKSIWSDFKSLLANMIVSAARNKILFSMGLGGSVAGSAASAAGTSAMAGGAGALGAIGSIAGAGISGAGLAASSFISGGFSGLAGTIGAQVSAAATGSLTAIAGAVGAIAAPLLAVAGAVMFFKKSTVELGRGLRVTVDGMDAMVETFKKTKTSRFFGLSSSIDKSFKTASDAVASPIQSAVSEIGSSIMAAADVLNFSTDALSSVRFQFSIKTKKKTQEQIQAAFQAQLDQLSEISVRAVTAQFGGAFQAMQLAGESGIATLQRLGNHLQAVNATFDTLGTRLFDANIWGANFASRLVQLFGSVDAFNSAISTYYQNFYSEAERFSTLTRQTTEALAALGYQMPETREQFRAMIEGLDLTTDAGRYAYAELVKLSGSVAQLVPSLISTLIGSTSSSVSEMISEITEAANAASRAASDWMSAADGLRDFIHGLNATSTSAISAQARLAGLTRDMNLAFSAAMGGDVAAAQGFGGVAGDYLEAARAQAASAVEYRRIEASVRAQAAALTDVADTNATEQSMLVDLAQQQVDLLTQLNDYLQGSIVTGEGLAAFAGMLAGMNIPGFNELIGALGVPGFASGGMHGGGLRIVGENGPELEATGAARYYSSAQTQSLISGGGRSDKNSLRSEVADMKETMTQIGLQQLRLYKRTSDILRKWDAIGLPVEQNA